MLGQAEKGLAQGTQNISSLSCQDSQELRDIGTDFMPLDVFGIYLLIPQFDPEHAITFKLCLSHQ